MTYTIKVNDVIITVEKKKIKNMYLRVVPPKGQVKISAPHSISREKIIQFAESKIDWIKEKQKQTIINSEKSKKQELKYIDGEKHYLWGKTYTLKIIKRTSKNKEVFIEDDNIYLPINSENNSFEKREKAMNEFYRKEIKNKIPEVLEKCVNVVGKRPNEWRVKNMKTRWGTCNTRDKRIWLNLQLAKKPMDCLEYVTIHELTHLYVPNHGKEFKEYMDIFCPNWKELKKKLNNKN
ncbi:M48 family metallopeptidase [Methanobrevibacter boviskoreani]|uniref:M48 family metallopeptidase n=1 Tax=Methanobrevibacter boviskoreani TaxID=1348249 RepID=UPI000594CED8|nr:SprT family zinc-dependent metalloprotease [Methanobrevibacter boviskoreani]MCI6775229.1 M48 family metallopeptidase [Methanobrevibacter boviskoreani]